MDQRLGRDPNFSHFGDFRNGLQEDESTSYAKSVAFEEALQLLTNTQGNSLYFYGLEPYELAEITEAFEFVRIPKGMHIVRQGDVARFAGLVVQGSAQADLGNNRALNIGPGDFVGEMALFQGGSRAVDVLSMDDSTVVVLLKLDIAQNFSEDNQVLWTKLLGMFAHSALSTLQSLAKPRTMRMGEVFSAHKLDAETIYAHLQENECAEEILGNSAEIVDVKVLCEYLKFTSVQQGQKLFHKGCREHAFIYLLKGKIEGRTDSRSPSVSFRRRSQQWWGEPALMALLATSNQTNVVVEHTLVASTACTVVMLDRPALNALAAAHPTIAQLVLLVVCKEELHHLAGEAVFASTKAKKMLEDAANGDKKGRQARVASLKTARIMRRGSLALTEGPLVGSPREEPGKEGKEGEREASDKEGERGEANKKAAEEGSQSDAESMATPRDGSKGGRKRGVQRPIPWGQAHQLLQMSLGLSKGLRGLSTADMRVLGESMKYIHVERGEYIMSDEGDPFVALVLSGTVEVTEQMPGAQGNLTSKTYQAMAGSLLGAIATFTSSSTTPNIHCTSSAAIVGAFLPGVLESITARDGALGVRLVRIIVQFALRTMREHVKAQAAHPMLLHTKRDHTETKVKVQMLRDCLRGTPFQTAAGLKEAGRIQLLAEKMQIVKIPPSGRVCSIGDLGLFVAIIVEGSVAVHVDGAEHKALYERTVGDCLGEEAFLMHGSSELRVTMEDVVAGPEGNPVTLAVLTQEGMRALHDRSPKVAQQLYIAVAQCFLLHLNTRVLSKSAQPVLRAQSRKGPMLAPEGGDGDGDKKQSSAVALPGITPIGSSFKGVASKLGKIGKSFGSKRGSLGKAPLLMAHSHQQSFSEILLKKSANHKTTAEVVMSMAEQLGGQIVGQSPIGSPAGLARYAKVLKLLKDCKTFNHTWRDFDDDELSVLARTFELIHIRVSVDMVGGVLSKPIMDKATAAPGWIMILSGSCTWLIPHSGRNEFIMHTLQVGELIGDLSSLCGVYHMGRLVTGNQPIDLAILTPTLLIDLVASHPRTGLKLVRMLVHGSLSKASILSTCLARLEDPKVWQVETPAGDSLLEEVARMKWRKDWESKLGALHDRHQCFGAVNTVKVPSMMPFFQPGAVKKGSVLIQKGQVATAMLLVITGKLEVRESGPESRLLGKVGVGEFLGEDAFISHIDSQSTRGASVYAISDTQIASVSYEDLEALNYDHPQVGLDLMMHILGEVVFRVIDQELSDKEQYSGSAGGFKRRDKTHQLPTTIKQQETVMLNLHMGVRVRLALDGADKEEKTAAMLVDCQQKSRFWKGFAEDEIRILAESMMVLEVEEGAVILEKGERATFVGILASGTAHVVLDGGQRSGVIEQGDLIGEVALFHGSQRNARVLAKGGPCIVACFLMPAFVEFYLEYAHLGLKMLRLFAHAAVTKIRATRSAAKRALAQQESLQQAQHNLVVPAIHIFRSLQSTYHLCKEAAHEGQNMMGEMLNYQDLFALSEMMSLFEVEPGTQVIAKGTLATNVLFVLKGRLAAHPDGKDSQVLGHRIAGEFIGEEAFLADYVDTCERRVDVFAATHCLLGSITHEQLAMLTETHTVTAMRLYARLGDLNCMHKLKMIAESNQDATIVANALANHRETIKRAELERLREYEAERQREQALIKAEMEAAMRLRSLPKGSPRRDDSEGSPRKARGLMSAIKEKKGGSLFKGRAAPGAAGSVAEEAKEPGEGDGAEEVKEEALAPEDPKEEPSEVESSDLETDDDMDSDEDEDEGSVAGRARGRRPMPKRSELEKINKKGKAEVEGKEDAFAGAGDGGQLLGSLRARRENRKSSILNVEVKPLAVGEGESGRAVPASSSFRGEKTFVQIEEDLSDMGGVEWGEMKVKKPMSHLRPSKCPANMQGIRGIADTPDLDDELQEQVKSARSGDAAAGPGTAGSAPPPEADLPVEAPPPPELERSISASPNTFLGTFNAEAKDDEDEEILMGVDSMDSPRLMEEDSLSTTDNASQASRKAGEVKVPKLGVDRIVTNPLGGSLPGMKGRPSRVSQIGAPPKAGTRGRPSMVTQQRFDDSPRKKLSLFVRIPGLREDPNMTPRTLEQLRADLVQVADTPRREALRQPVMPDKLSTLDQSIQMINRRATHIGGQAAYIGYGSSRSASLGMPKRHSTYLSHVYEKASKLGYIAEPSEKDPVSLSRPASPVKDDLPDSPARDRPASPQTAAQRLERAQAEEAPELEEELDQPQDLPATPARTAGGADSDSSADRTVATPKATPRRMSNIVNVDWTQESSWAPPTISELSQAYKFLASRAAEEEIAEPFQTRGSGLMGKSTRANRHDSDEDEVLEDFEIVTASPPPDIKPPSAAEMAAKAAEAARAAVSFGAPDSPSSFMPEELVQGTAATVDEAYDKLRDIMRHPSPLPAPPPGQPAGGGLWPAPPQGSAPGTAGGPAAPASPRSHRPKSEGPTKFALFLSKSGDRPAKRAPSQMVKPGRMASLSDTGRPGTSPGSLLPGIHGTARHSTGGDMRAKGSHPMIAKKGPSFRRGELEREASLRTADVAEMSSPWEGGEGSPPELLPEGSRTFAEDYAGEGGLEAMDSSLRLNFGEAWASAPHTPGGTEKPRVPERSKSQFDARMDARRRNKNRESKRGGQSNRESKAAEQSSRESRRGDQSSREGSKHGKLKGLDGKEDSFRFIASGQPALSLTVSSSPGRGPPNAHRSLKPPALGGDLFKSEPGTAAAGNVVGSGKHHLHRPSVAGDANWALPSTAALSSPRAALAPSPIVEAASGSHSARPSSGTAPVVVSARPGSGSSRVPDSLPSPVRNPPATDQPQPSTAPASRNAQLRSSSISSPGRGAPAADASHEGRGAGAEHGRRGRGERRRKLHTSHGTRRVSPRASRDGEGYMDGLASERSFTDRVMDKVSEKQNSSRGGIQTTRPHTRGVFSETYARGGESQHGGNPAWWDTKFFPTEGEGAAYPAFMQSQRGVKASQYKWRSPFVERLAAVLPVPVDRDFMRRTPASDLYHSVRDVQLSHSQAIRDFVIQHHLPPYQAPPS